MNKPTRAEPNQGHLASVESIAETGEGEFEDYYPESASGELEDEQTPYFVRNVIWIGDEGKMIRADPDYMQHIFGNIFDPDKLASIVNGIHDHPDRVRFYAPYGTASRIGRQEVVESQQYWEDEGLDRPYTTGDDELDEYLKDPEEAISYELIGVASWAEPGDKEWEEAKADLEKRLQEAINDEDGDFGSWAITVRDGNHRAFGAVLAGEPYVYVRLEDNQYQDLMQSKKTGTLTDEQKELLEMLD
jgi:hypothetical protein